MLHDHKSLVTKAVTSSLILPCFFFRSSNSRSVAEHYGDIAWRSVCRFSNYSKSALNSSIDTFLASPSAGNFEQVKQAWLESRAPYQQSEVFRFGNVVKLMTGKANLNAWPLDEGLDRLCFFWITNMNLVTKAQAQTSLRTKHSKLVKQQ